MSRPAEILVEVAAHAGGVPVFHLTGLEQIAGLEIGELWVAQTDKGAWQTLGQARHMRARLSERLGAPGNIVGQLVAAVYPELVR